MSKHRESAVQPVPTSATLPHSSPPAFPQDWFRETERLRALHRPAFPGIEQPAFAPLKPFRFVVQTDAAMSFEEIGRRLNCSRQTAEGLFKRGMNKLCKLRDQLEPLRQLSELRQGMCAVRVRARDLDWEIESEE